MGAGFTSVTDTQIDTHDPLRLGNCQECGYALHGLPDEGRCPECGRLYDQSTVVLHGWSHGSTSSVATARPWEAAAVVGVNALCIWYALSPGFKAVLYSPWTYVVIGYGAYVAWCLWRRWSSYMPGLIQVRLNPQGCCQVAAGRAAPAMVPWSKVRGVELDARRDGLARLRIHAPSTTWVRTKHFAVDALVKCTPEQVSALQERIRAWRAATSTEALFLHG
jgi:hypothetical protein